MDRNDDSRDDVVSPAKVAALRDECLHLRRAVQSRGVIGQDQGIIMSQLDIDAEQAIAYLMRVSSILNRKLAVIALEIAQSRQLPDLR